MITVIAMLLYLGSPVEGQLVETPVGPSEDEDPVVQGSPYLNGVLTTDHDLVNSAALEELFNYRSGWVVLPVWQWNEWGELTAYNIREYCQKVVDKGYTPIVRLSWKAGGFTGNPPGWRFDLKAPANAWCIPPEPASNEEPEQNYEDFLKDFVDWCREIAKIVGDSDPNNDQGKPAVCKYFIIGNEPNQACEHGGSGLVDPVWYGEVFCMCQAAMNLYDEPRSRLPLANDLRIIVAPITTDTKEGRTWKEYLESLVNWADPQKHPKRIEPRILKALQGIPYRHYAVHNNADVWGQNDPMEGTSDLDFAWELGYFERYIRIAYDTSRRTTDDSKQFHFYIDETNPFLHPGDAEIPWPIYAESWIINVFDAIAKYNDKQYAKDKYRPIRCACYYSWYTGNLNFDIILADGSHNETHNIAKIWEDFPLLVHRNDRPAPVVNLARLAAAYGGMQQDLCSSSPPPVVFMPGEKDAIDGDAETFWNGGKPWNSISISFNRNFPFERVLLWQRQASQGTTRVTAGGYMSGQPGPVQLRPVSQTRDGWMSKFTADDLNLSTIDGLRHTFDPPCIAPGTQYIDLGFYEISIFPPASALSSGWTPW